MKTVYKSKDGFDFENEEDCKLYEESIENGLSPLKYYLETDSSRIKCPKCKIVDIYSEKFIKKHKNHSNGFLVEYIEGECTITPFSVEKLK